MDLVTLLLGQGFGQGRRASRSRSWLGTQLHRITRDAPLPVQPALLGYQVLCDDSLGCYLIVYTLLYGNGQSTLRFMKLKALRIWNDALSWSFPLGVSGRICFSNFSPSSGLKVSISLINGSLNLG